MKVHGSTNHLVLNSKGLSIDCRHPIPGAAHVMGILNVTPDSFSDGGKYANTDSAVHRAEQMVEEGAKLIDVGGASSRPRGAAYGEGAPLVSAQEEMDRILPVIERIAIEMPDCWISVDTFRSDVAQQALAIGAHSINDITALRFDPDIASVCAAAKAPLFLMHSEGLPGAMPHQVEAANPVSKVVSELTLASTLALKLGCTQLVLDPGFGFGKTTQGNLQLISSLNLLTALGWPVLIGVSRKSTIGQLMARGGVIPDPNSRLSGSLGVTAVGILNGASIVRTHDVRETSDFLLSFHTTASLSESPLSYHAIPPSHAEPKTDS